MTAAMNNGVDYTNKKFNNWRVLKKGSQRDMWKVICSCGRVSEIDKHNLLKGRAKGCRNCVGNRYSKNNNPNWRGTKDIPHSLFSSLFWNAKIRNIAVLITINDLQTLWNKSKEKCALSGLSIRLEETASVDRIDSSKSYTKSNIQWVHKDIQKMKNDLPQKRFVNCCKYVAKQIRRIR